MPIPPSALFARAGEGPVLHRLVVHRAGPEPVHVFLPHEPAADGPPGELVLLRDLAPWPARAVLGRSTRSPAVYRVFRSEVELLLAGFEPAGAYRVCDSWDEYLDPWSPYEMNEQPTERMEQTEAIDGADGL